MRIVQLKRSLPLFGCLLLALTGSQAAAQGFFQLGNRKGLLEFGFDRHINTISSDELEDRRFRLNRFDWRVGFQGSLDVIHPTLLSLNFSTAVGRSQEGLVQIDKKLPGSSRLLAYDLAAHFFSGEKASFSFFSNRSQNINVREFVGTSEILGRNRGVTAFYRAGPLPSTVSYRQESFREDLRLGGIAGGLEGTRDEARDIFSYDTQRYWERQQFNFSYERARIEDHLRPRFSYTGTRASLNHRFFLNEQSSEWLSSRFHYTDRKDERGFTFLSLNEDLHLEHSETFSSSYYYNLLSHSASDSQTTTHSAGSFFQHSLYESLSTGLNLQASRSSFSDNSQQKYLGRFTADYRKRLPGGGVLLANLSGSYELADARLQGEIEVPILQERHQVRIGIPVRLTQPLVIATSIVVIGESTGILYQEGLDYFLRIEGNLAEIVVIGTGRIQEGDFLLIDYRINASPSNKFSTWSNGSSLSVDYGWFLPYYGYQRRSQNLLSGINEGILENLRAHTLGMRFRWEGARYRVLLQNEYRTQDSVLTPLSSLTFNQFLAFSPRRLVTVSLSFDEALIHFKNPSRETRSGTGRINVAWLPLPGVTVDGSVSLRLYRDTITEGETYRQVSLRVGWFVGKFNVSSSYRRVGRMRGGIMSQESVLFFRIAREF